MGVVDTLALAMTSLTGGVFGAAAGAYIAGLRFGATMEGFRAAFSAYMVGRNDEPSQMLNTAFEELDTAWKAFGSALARLGSAAKTRTK